MGQTFLITSPPSSMIFSSQLWFNESSIRTRMGCKSKESTSTAAEFPVYLLICDPELKAFYMRPVCPHLFRPVAYSILTLPPRNAWKISLLSISVIFSEIPEMEELFLLHTYLIFPLFDFVPAAFRPGISTISNMLSPTTRGPVLVLKKALFWHPSSLGLGHVWN